jgi:hypothetical protein
MRSRSNSRVLFALVVALCTLAVPLAACSAPPAAAPTATHAAPKATATMNTGGRPTIGGPVADFQKKLRQNGSCPGSAAGPDCYCGTLGDSNCDYSVTVTVADSAVTEIFILGLNEKQETWDLSFTTGTCILYMGGATVATVGGQVTKAGVYVFDLGSRKVYLHIDPGSCLINIT